VNLNLNDAQLIKTITLLLEVPADTDASMWKLSNHSRKFFEIIASLRDEIGYELFP